MAISTLDPRMAFNCEQYDKYSGVTNHYVLLFFYEDGTLEMIQRKNGKVYVKRHKTDIPRTAFFLGAEIPILGKMSKIISYADEVTTKLCEDQNERTTLIVSDFGMGKLGKTISVITVELGMTISNIQLAWINQETIQKYELPDVLQGTSVAVLQCVSEKCMEKGIEVMQRLPGVIAATDRYVAQLWGDLCSQMARQPLAVFNEKRSTVVILKPHVIEENLAGNIIQQICDQGLEITGFAQITMNTTVMDKLLQPYQGVLPDIEGTVQSMVGTIWAVQLMSPQGADVVQLVRELCGPYDTVIARKLRPESIRGKFGRTQVLNAVHCCDLPRDSPIYADTLFKPSESFG